MVKVKICGIQREEDVLYINRYLPEYAGFVFAESRRRVSPEQGALLAEALDKGIKKVGVFVNEDHAVIINTIKQCKLDVVQLHGDENAGYIDGLYGIIPAGTKIWKAIRVKDASSLSSLDGPGVDGYVLDAYTEEGYGGTGKTIDWKLAGALGDHAKVILAGGLTPENVFEAVSIVKPYAVDVSSGVETDGRKDEMKIRDFIYSARNKRNRML